MADHIYGRSRTAGDLWHIITRIRRSQPGNLYYAYACGGRVANVPISADPGDRLCVGCANASDLGLVGEVVHTPAL